MRLFAIFAALLSLQLCLILAKADLRLPKCVKIVSINTPLDDPTRAAENYGVRADKRRAMLTDKPGIFRIREGLTDEKGTVSLEALFHPRFYLRHKNYHFHLEKEVNNSVFYKDATFFILKVTEHPTLYAFELYSHPTWFMRHLKHKPYTMVLRKVNESSKDVLDSTFFLAPHRCFPKQGNDSNAEKKTVLVGDGTFIDTADEDADIATAKANDLNAEDFEKAYLSKEKDEKDDSIVIHTEDDKTDDGDDKKPIKIHTEADSSEESQEEILKEIEDAFRTAQNTNNSTYLEKIEKDIEEKVNTIAEKASDYLNKPSIHTRKKNNGKTSAVHDIEIHTESDKPENTKKIDSESDVDEPSHEQDSIHNSSEDNKTERTQRVEVLGPVIDLTKPLDQNDETDIDKEIVVTGQPKLNGKLTIDTTYQYSHPPKLKNREKERHKEKLAGFSIDDVITPKTRSNRTSKKTPLHLHAVRNKAYKDLTVANKALNSNIEKLRNVLEAIEDVPSDNKASEKGTVIVKDMHPNALYHQQNLNKNKRPSLALSGTPEVHQNPPYLPQTPSDLKVLKSQSTVQTTVTELPHSPFTTSAADEKASTPIQNSRAKASPLKNNSGNKTQLATVEGANTIPPTSTPGLHVIQGTRDLPSGKAGNNMSYEVFDHLASELVDHDTTGNPTPVTAGKGTRNTVTDWMKNLKPHNASLQETFNELNPVDSAKIFYFDKCEDKFPKACEDWAAQRYCLTFSELMKRYCRKACKLCNHVLATGFTTCDKTCGGGIRLRMIKVNNRQVLQRRSCNVQNCPVNGGYTPYSDWSECSVTCGEGVRYRHRSCTSPKPQFGGRDCSHLGAPVDTMPCVKGCKGFKPSKYHSSLNSGLKKSKHHTDRLSPEEFPEYHAEEANPKASDPVGEKEADLDSEEDEEEDSASTNETSTNQDYGHEFEWPNKHHRHKPVVLKHVHKNVYKHRDDYGNNHYLNVDEEQSPYDQLQTHVVRYQGRQVAKMQCGPSRLLNFQKHPSNSPMAFKRSNPYKLFDAGGIVYDKDGVPSDTTTNVVQAFDSPYKIILQKGKNNQMKVLEQCIESDASVNPEADLKLGEQGLAMASEQRSLPTTSASTPAANSLASNRFAENGLYEYKYQDIGEGVDDNKIDSDVSDQLTRAIKNEEAEISQKSLRSQDPKPTLKEELFAEKEEAWREKKYEDSLARRAKVMS